MRAMLEERKHGASEWLHDFKHWININKCFYNLRNRLAKLGYDIDQPYPDPNVTKQSFLTFRRKRIIASVKGICDNWYGNGRGIKRTQLGIYADKRSTFAFNGKEYLVGVHDIEDLAELGTDIMLVEKPEVVGKLAPFTKNVGIALLTCSGNYVEYALELCDQAHKQGCNVFILGDADIAAIAMALRLPYAKHLGLDLNTLRSLGMNARDVDEPYEPSESQYKFVADKLRFFKALSSNGEISDLVASGNYIIGGENGHFDEYEYNDKSSVIHYNVPLLKKLADNPELWDYLKHRRIELDIFIEDDNFNLQEFWNLLVHQMLSFYPNRDYNRAFTKYPNAFECRIIAEHTSKLYSMTQPVVDNKIDEVVTELKKYEGFTNVDKKYQDFTANCNYDLVSNPLVMDLMKDLNRVMNKKKYKSLIPKNE